MTGRPVAAALLAGAALVAVPGPAAHAVPHEVVYTVTAETEVGADIYYREVNPPNWADYSHDPYRFTPRARVDLGPGRPWVLRTTLEDPQRWAMVVVTGTGRSVESTFRCELSVDGAVVATSTGPKGALCALRHW